MSSPGDKRARDSNAEEGAREGILFQATCWAFKSEPCVLDQSTSLRLCCAKESPNQRVLGGEGSMENPKIALRDLKTA